MEETPPGQNKNPDQAAFTNTLSKRTNGVVPYVYEVYCTPPRNPQPVWLREINMTAPRLPPFRTWNHALHQKVAIVTQEAVLLEI